MEYQGTPYCQNNLEKKRTKLEASYFLISKHTTKQKQSRCCGPSIKIYTDQWNRTESSETIPYVWLNGF